MKHFLVEITYTAPQEAIRAAVAGHRAYLQAGYDQGLLLLSGPRIPFGMGFILCRFESIEALDAFFTEDPFKKEGLAEYKVSEFSPVKHQPALTDWVAGK